MSRAILLSVIFLAFTSCESSKEQNIKKLLHKADQIDSTEEYARSMPLYDSVLILDSTNLQALNNGARSRIFLHDTAGSLKMIEKAISLHHNWHSYVLRGGIYMALRDKRSVADLRNALQSIPDKSMIYGYMANYYYFVSIQKDSAMFYAGKVVSAGSPKTIEPLVSAMSTYLFYNEYKPLLQACDSIIAYAPSHGIALTAKTYAYNNRGYALLRLGQPQAAAQSIRRSLAILPKNSYAWKNLGLVYLYQHQTDSACILFEKARELGYTAQYGNEVDSLIRVNCQ